MLRPCDVAWLPPSARAKSNVVEVILSGPHTWVFHGLVVGRAELQCGEQHIGADVPAGRRQRVRVLEHLAEAAGGLHRAKHGQRGGRRGRLELQQPLEVLTRQARARAHQVLHEHATRGVGVAQLELRQHGGHRRVPRQLSLAHQRAQHQRRHGLGVGRDHVEGVAIHRRRLPQLPHAEADGRHHLATLHQANRHARHTQRLLRAFHEGAELLDPRSVQGVRLAPRKRLALIPLGQQAPEDQLHLRQALLACRLRHVVDPHRPLIAVAHRPGDDVAALVRRDLIDVRPLVLPAVLVRTRGLGLQRPLRIRAVGRPGAGHCCVGVGGLHVDQHDARVTLGRLDNRGRSLHRDGPSGRRDERRAGDRRAWRVDGQRRLDRLSRTRGASEGKQDDRDGVKDAHGPKYSGGNRG